jgi:lipopolysaccharide export LptBFGC system permease protein LptF
MPLVMMILAMPLGFQFGRKGTLYGLATGLVGGLSFLGLFELVKQLGATGIINPVAAGWSVVVVFGSLALYRFINME